MPQLLASLFLHHEPAPIDYHSAMVAFIESSLMCSELLRARPCERGTIFVTEAETTVPALFPQQSSTKTQRLQGESPSFTASLHPPHQSNQQYSILSLSDSSGAVVERISYTAYGQPTFTNAAGTILSSSAKAARHTHTGREWDPSVQLHHFRARWMSGASGRFLGRDPIGFEGSKWELYEFLNSRALSNTDPYGEFVTYDTVPIDGRELALLRGCSCGMTFKTPKPGNGEAWVACDGKGGFKIKRQPEKDIKNFECLKNCGGLTCMAEHENHHISQFLALCTKACEPGCGRIYGEDEGGIGMTAGACTNVAEFYAGRVHLNCLNKKQFEDPYNTRDCGGKSCRAWLKEFFDSYKRAFQSKYGCQDPAKLPEWIDPTK